jgi:hypothetical protein
MVRYWDQKGIKEKLLTITTIFGLLFIIVAIIVLYLEINLFKLELLNADIFKPSDTSIFTNFGAEDLNKPSITNSNKGCLFDPFIKLFHQGQIGKFNTFYFVPNGFTTSQPFYSGTVSNTANSFCLGEYIVYYEFHKVFILQDYIKILEEFSKVLK